MSTYSMNMVAGEDLLVSRVVRATATAEGSQACLMADSTAVEPVGITQEGSYYPPGIGANSNTLAAPSGRGVHVYGLGNTALCVCGGTVTAGTRVKVAAANGVIQSLEGDESGGEWTVGVAEEDGEADELVRVFIDPQQVSRPVS